jgi:predicted nucleic acid-binding protein
MIVAIQDANIIIDLLDIGFFAQTFKLRINFHSTHFVLGEITEAQMKLITPLIDKGLLVINNANEFEVADIFNLNSQVKALSVADCSVFLLAERLQATILSGDRYLRNYAKKHELNVHGILWIFDQLVRNNVISKSQACQKLKLLMSINKRLPGSECVKLLKLWGEN